MTGSMTDIPDLEELVPDRRLRKIKLDIGKRKERWLGWGRPENVPLWRLADFALRNDRRWSPFFVGREDEIAELEYACEETFECVRRGEAATEGATALLQGAPGAGKTAILSELQRRWRLSLTKEYRPPVAIRLTVGQMSDEATVATAVAEAVDPKVAREWRTTTGKEIRRGGGASLIVEYGGEYGTTSTVEPMDIDLASLAILMPPRTWKRPVVLMVDEIQRIGPEAGDVIDALHQASTNLPIVPLYAGLGDSATVLRKKAGLSRLSEGYPRTVGRLDPGQPAEAVRKMLESFRITGTPALEREWAERIEEETDLWPQHLHTAMSSLARGLVGTDRDLAAVNRDIVLAHAERRRRKSYFRRLSNSMKSLKTPLARIAFDLSERGKEREETVTLIRSRLPDDPSRREAEGFLDHLVHQGTLLEDDDGRYACPIPTFRRYLIREGGLDPDAEPEARLSDDDGGFGGEPP